MHPEPVKLTAEEKAELERIAARLGCLASRGPRTGKPSWRVLLKRIAAGELLVSGEYVCRKCGIRQEGKRVPPEF